MFFYLLYSKIQFFEEKVPKISYGKRINTLRNDIGKLSHICGSQVAVISYRDDRLNHLLHGRPRCVGLAFGVGPLGLFYLSF